MRFLSILIAVRDIEASKKFYMDLFGLKIVEDYGANVAFRGGLALQTLDTWADFIEKQPKDIAIGSNDKELYFEENNLDKLIKKLDAQGVKYVHPVREYPWGQRAVRFYDPDGHIIEVGESMRFAIKRLLKQGMSAEQVAQKTMQSPESVRQIAARL